MQVQDDKAIHQLAEMLLHQGIYSEEQVDALSYALVVVRDFSEHIWNISFNTAMLAMQNTTLSVEEKRDSLIDMQIYLREIYLHLHDLKFFGIETT